MDFLDYQTYGLEDTTTNDSSLPEPASRIKIQSERSSIHLENDFQLPDLKATNQTGVSNSSTSLQGRMQKYASLSLELLTASEIPQYTGGESTPSSKGTLPRGDSLKQLLKSKEDTASDADLLLSKKLSRVLSNYSSGPLSNIQLRKSFEILEDNREKLKFKSDTIVRADYLGFLARKSLRSELENELLRSHLTIIEELQPIVRRVKKISQPVKSLQEMGSNVLSERSSQNSKKLNLDMEAIFELRKNIEELRLKKQLLDVIRDKLTLTQLEEEILVNAPVNEELFKVVNKLMAIKETASYLLSLENPKAGQTLLTQVNSKMERANKRIYNYLVNFFHDLHTTSKTFGERAFASDDKSLMTFQKCMVYLSNDLPLFNEVLNKIVKLRSQRVLNEFLSQFDFDSSKGSKPIIMSAHDPVRYLGDVLANVHSLIVDEADFMASMFKFQELDIQGTPKSLLQENGEFLDGLGVKLLNETFKPSENSIRIRLEQIIRFEDNPLVNFDICELLKLYEMMFIKYGIFPDSSLIKHLDSLKESAGNEILTGILKLMDSERKAETENGLLPPEWLSDYLNSLCEFFSKLEKSGSLEESQSVVDASFIKKTVGQLVYGKILEYHQDKFPLAKRNRKEKISMLLSEINCLDLVLARITPYKSSIFQVLASGDVYGNIDAQLDQSVKSAINLETTDLFEKMGLALYCNLFNMIFPVESVEDELDYEMYFPARDNPIMSVETIGTNVHDKLNESLPDISNDIQDNLIFNIISPKIADRILLGCLQNLSKFYEVFRKSLQQLYPDAQEEIIGILNFTEQEFNTLIGLS